MIENNKKDGTTISVYVNLKFVTPTTEVTALLEDFFVLSEGNNKTVLTSSGNSHHGNGSGRIKCTNEVIKNDKQSKIKNNCQLNNNCIQL
jgi:hypothetical protein